MASGRLRRRLGRINQSLADRPVHSLTDRVQIPEEPSSPVVQISKRVLAALGALFAAVFIVYLDRDGYRDVQDNPLSDRKSVV